MAPTLRGRLVCFYCGCKSAKKRTASIKSWQCEKCDAVNHLDENGDITDPPTPSDILTKTRYAQSIRRPSSPVFDVPDESIFCQTCIKNQLLYSQSLASYFPSADAPDYAEYERVFPEFQKGLEDRYPQVCEDCEPRVRERIHATSYAAKTDHLRRMMEKTREGSSMYSASSWKSRAVFLGGVTWLASWAGQAFWNVVGLLNSKNGDEGFLDKDIPMSGSSCFQQAFQSSSLAPGCIELINTVDLVALILGFLSFWWNPRRQENNARRGGRIVGEKDYYFLQGLLLVIRCASFAYLTRTSYFKPASQVIHASSLVLGLLFNIISFRSIRIDYSSRVLFQESPEPLVSRRPQQNGALAKPNQANSNPYNHVIKPAVRPFSISDFAPPREQQHPPLYQPPTPPPDDDDNEAMDWTPTQESNFRPASLYRDPSSFVQQPQESPFHGRLPPNIVSQAHRLRNPPNQPTFRKASTKQKQGFFNTPVKRVIRDSDSDAASPAATTASDLSPLRFTATRFFPQSDHHSETGLEDILATSFTLNEEPAEIQKQRQMAEQLRQSTNSTIIWQRTLIAFVFLAFCLLWMYVGCPLPNYQPWLRAIQRWATGSKNPERNVEVQSTD